MAGAAVFASSFKMMLSFLLFIFLGLVAAEDGLDGWLRYAALPQANRYHHLLPSDIIALNSTKSSPIYTAGIELQDGFNGIFGKKLRISHETRGKPRSSVLVGTLDAYSNLGRDAGDVPELEADGFWLSIKGRNVQIVGQNERGALYGAFEYLSRLAQGDLKPTTFVSNPDAPIRWVNQWDNLQDGGTHGSVERGYGGPSIFFKDGFVKDDLTRVGQYGRLLASIGVNAIVANNVNANFTVLSDRNLEGLKRIADELRPYGVQLGMSLYFASPQEFGGLDTFDPLDEQVIQWWDDMTDKIYEHIPDMAGYLVKANSEGQPGPMTYNRTLSEGANLFARAIKPHGGIVMFRAFVYDHTTLNQTLDWKADRANAAVDYFGELDGEFDDNVVVQIKYGPIDFQVREPVSPLFANLHKTSSAIELQITQEYLGQQCHLVYLGPLWKTILDFDLRVDDKPSAVSDIISGKRFDRKLGGYAGVVNVGTNTTWLGSHLAMSNLYAYGRMAWNPRAGSKEILQDWTRLTFGLDRRVVDTITKMSMESWRAYENYSGNLGIQTLTDILYGHYGPNPGSQDHNPWGQWTRADSDSIGMDRTVWNGTGFSGQYPPEIAAQYEKVETTPDDLLLWFHHVPYTHRLKSGKTVIQHFYDAHYEGSAKAQTFVPQWESLRGKIDKERYEHTLHRLVYQAGHSLVWRDTVNGFYRKMSGIADAKKRVWNHKYRIEAESMKLSGYELYAVDPHSTASNATAIVTCSNSTMGIAETTSPFRSGTYDLAVNYYDLAIGRSQWELFVNNRRIGTWEGDSEYVLGHAPSIYIDGISAMRITFPRVKVRKNDKIKIVGKPDGDEPAPVDYISLLPPGKAD
ncbi:hypothetical protein AJ80_05990 [Polytolypa hystricis UAMH7299]|uniref:Alpha-glucuronidase n=1 Tax=Polytolypa hystricis (strain UAMH7299) TaxID=1447883 RepID=A0A2B7XZ01_POLH7|nr:hypothetical protein AJ80_05990 [Polytolypa hystricis UAMH7299]